MNNPMDPPIFEMRSNSVIKGCSDVIVIAVLEKNMSTLTRSATACSLFAGFR